jgi:hypothetical protein
MKLTSMKREAEHGTAECVPCCGEAYPYGLQLYLSGDACEKLGISKALPPGTQVTIQAKAIVASASESLCPDGKDVSISLQITDLGVDKAGGMSAAAAAKTLYPDND